MKVIHVITGLGLGGAEMSLFRLCSETRKFPDIYSVVISLTKGGNLKDKLSKIGIKVVEFDFRSVEGILRGSVCMFRLLRSEKPDVVQTWMYHSDLIGGLIAKVAGVKNVVWGIHNTNLDLRTSSKKTILIVRILAKLSKYIPKLIISCSERAKDYHISLGYSAKKILVINNGIDFDEFSIDESARLNWRRERQLNDNMICLGVVARNSPQKDYANFLKALQLLQKQGIKNRAVLVGRGVTKLKNLVIELKLNSYIELCEETDRVADILNGIDILVLPSAYGEALPTILIEAMACGTICVTTDVGDVREIIGDYGCVVPPKDSKKLAETIKIAIQRLGTINQFSNRIKMRSFVLRKFSIQKMFLEYLKAWRYRNDLKGGQ